MSGFVVDKVVNCLYVVVFFVLRVFLLQLTLNH